MDTAGRVVRRFRRNQRLEELSRRFPVSHQPMRHHRRIDARNFRKRADDQCLRGADTELACDQLQPQEGLLGRQRLPRFLHQLLLAASSKWGNGRMRSATTSASDSSAVEACGGITSDNVSARFADGVVGFFEQPQRQSRRLRGPLAQTAPCRPPA